MADTQNWHAANEVLKVDAAEQRWNVAVLNELGHTPGGLVALAFGYSPEGVVRRAHLLAAAPALLEALEVALRFIENTEGELGITLDSGQLARAAIAIAKGEAK